MKKVWPLFNMLQLLTTFPKIIPHPTNVEPFIDAVWATVNLQIVPPEYMDKIMALFNGEESSEEDDQAEIEGESLDEDSTSESDPKQNGRMLENEETGE